MQQAIHINASLRYEIAQKVRIEKKIVIVETKDIETVVISLIRTCQTVAETQSLQKRIYVLTKLKIKKG